MTSLHVATSQHGSLAARRKTHRQGRCCEPASRPSESWGKPSKTGASGPKLHFLIHCARKRAWYNFRMNPVDQKPASPQCPHLESPIPHPETLLLTVEILRELIYYRIVLWHVLGHAGFLPSIPGPEYHSVSWILGPHAVLFGYLDPPRRPAAAATPTPPLPMHSG